MMERIGIVHPGAMGSSVAASAQNSGNTVYWASDGRSPQTRERAEQLKLVDAHSLQGLSDSCTVLVSVCPPSAAEFVAREIAGYGFQGLYVDANAIAPARANHIAEIITGGGAAFVDGGIIGGPAWQAGTTWLYLSGGEAQRAAACFEAGPLETAVIGAEIGKASALKMCFAAYTKGTTALLSTILAAAESLQVRKELAQQWNRNDPDSAAQIENRVQRSTAKAWRFAGEMQEIAGTMEAVGLPDGFHLAAADIFDRLAGFKYQEATPPLAEVLASLLAPDVSSSNADS